MWSRRTLTKYALIQLPEVVVLFLCLVLVRRWINVSEYVLGWIILIWIAKDIISYPFVWRAYSCRSHSPADAMIGLRGIVESELSPTGYISVRGELWNAKAIQKGVIISKGKGVIVRKIRGLTLLVEHDAAEKVPPNKQPV